MKMRTEAVRLKSLNPDQAVFLTTGGEAGRRIEAAVWTFFMFGLIGTSVSYGAFLSKYDPLISFAGVAVFSVFSLLGFIFMFAATRTIFDKLNRKIIRSLDIGIQLRRSEFDFSQFSSLTLSQETKGEGRRQRTRYPVRLIGNSEMLELDAPGHQLSAQNLAYGAAEFMGLSIQDSTPQLLQRDIRAKYLEDNSFFYSGYVCFLRQLHLSTVIILVAISSVFLWGIVLMFKSAFLFAPFFAHLAILVLILTANLCENGVTAK